MQSRFRGHCKAKTTKVCVVFYSVVIVVIPFIVVFRRHSRVGQILGLTQNIRRITNRHRGMKEDTTSLVQAFVICRFTYVAPYLVLAKEDINKINRLIRKAPKQALGLPVSTPTTNLLQMGLHNTIKELIEGHISSQRLCLAQTQAGRTVLHPYQVALPRTDSSGPNTRCLALARFNSTSSKKHASGPQSRPTGSPKPSARTNSWQPFQCCL